MPNRIKETPPKQPERRKTPRDRPDKDAPSELEHIDPPREMSEKLRHQIQMAIRTSRQRPDAAEYRCLNAGPIPGAWPMGTARSANGLPKETYQTRSPRHLGT